MNEQASVSYLESWKAIELANAIFGFTGWGSAVKQIDGEYVEHDKSSDKWKVGVSARVVVTLKDGTSHEDVGFGSHENKSKATAIENAKKEAVSDARKRALRLFGNALGNSVYDKVHTVHEVKSKVKGAPMIPKGPVSYDGLRAKVDLTQLFPADITSALDSQLTQATPSPAPLPPKTEPITPIGAQTVVTLPTVLNASNIGTLSPSHAPDAGRPQTPVQQPNSLVAHAPVSVSPVATMFRSSPQKSSPAPAQIATTVTNEFQKAVSATNGDDDMIDYEQIAQMERKAAMDKQHKSASLSPEATAITTNCGASAHVTPSSQNGSPSVTPLSALSAAEKAAQFSEAMIGIEFDI